MSEIENQYVEIKNTPLSMTPNLFGGGWLLLCSRGINCEFHTQVVSAHATNTPDPEDVSAVVEKHLPAIQKSWSGFCDMVKGWNEAGQDYESMEGIGVQLLRNWCNRIVSEAEKVFNERWANK